MEATKLHAVVADALLENVNLAISEDILNLIAQIKANESSQITVMIARLRENFAKRDRKSVV